MKRAIILIILSVFTLPAMAQLNMNQIGKLTYPNELSDIWGWVDSLGREYALVGVWNGISIVDVDTPATPHELHWIPGPRSTWRDLKTWNNHAYVVHDNTSGGDTAIGITIIDLNFMPDSIIVDEWKGDTLDLETSHNIWIDENGVAYLFGSSYGNGGAVMLDLSSPKAPQFMGNYNTNYIHDGYTRGDTMWSGEIYRGWVAGVDVTNKTAPSVMGTHLTPNQFTHNVWPNDSTTHVFTTDEVSGAFLGSYDVTDMANIKEVDRIQSSPGSGVIPHNTHVLNDWLVTSYYRDGVTIHDGNRPTNLVEVGFFDTSPMSGNGFNGCWGVYPFLPSGNVLATDIEEGLFILGATYVRACYLEGNITDSVTTNPLSGAMVEILTTSTTESSDVSGDYATGYHSAGTFTVEISKLGYITKTVTGVTLTNGVVTNLDVELVPLPTFAVTGNVLRMSDSTGIPFAHYLIGNDTFEFSGICDGTGAFSSSSVFNGTYDVIAGLWGYVTNATTNVTVSGTSVNVTIYLDEGWYDDFIFDFGWTRSGSASAGLWERGEPVGTTFGSDESNPDEDVPMDWGDKAYVTGNGGGGAGSDDVDNGTTILRSPDFDVSSYYDPYIRFHTWFFNDGGSGSPNDSIYFVLSNGSTQTQIHGISLTQRVLGDVAWVDEQFRIADYFTPGATMHIKAYCGDWNPGHLVEGGLDLFRVIDSTDAISPEITVTAPVDGDTGVSLTSNVQITFNEAMDTSSFAFTISPDPGGWNSVWNTARDKITLTHAGFTGSTLYMVDVTAATDLAGNPLAPGSVPNPFDFTTEAPGPSGISNAQEAGITVWPNPFNEQTTITFSIPGDHIIKVYDELGRSVLSGAPVKGSNSYRISSEELSIGAYILEVVRDGKAISISKLIVID